jgi:hypothetical protein
MGYDEDGITTPEEGEELPAVIVEDVTDPEPEPEVEGSKPRGTPGVQWEPIRCEGIKANGEPCNGIAKGGTGYCMRHQDQVPGHLEEIVAEPHPAPKEPDNGELKPYPFHDGQVSEVSQIRVIRMVIPLCPIDSVPEIKQRDGTYRPNPNFSGEQNCQQVYKFNNMGRWDAAKCESLGHDPWHTSFRYPIIKEVLDNDGYVIDTKVQYRVEKRLNIIQVSDNIRHSSGMEVQLAMARGCRPLEDFGVSSPCEFRNCSQPQRIDTRYGKYCSERHARLVAADKQGKILPVASDPYSADQANREREDMLENLNIRKGA